MVQIFDIVKELSEDPIFLSLSRDLMYSTATKKVVLMRYLMEIHPICCLLYTSDAADD